MSNLSRREDVWSKAYVLSGEASPADFADNCLKEFDKRFPPAVPYSDEVPPSVGLRMYDAGKVQHSDEVWTACPPSPKFGSDYLQETARQLTKYFLESQQEELLKLVGKYSIQALGRIRDTADIILRERAKEKT